MKAVVLCAGFGTRLGKLTKKIPKPMLKLNGKPLLWYTLRYLKEFGFTQVAINLHFMPEVITEYFQTGESMGVKLYYFYEEIPLGTAGAIRNLSNWLSGEDAVLVLYGDILLNQSLSELVETHNKENSFATLLLHQSKRSNSVVKMNRDRQITLFLERPCEEERQKLVNKDDRIWVNSGLQILSKKAIQFIRETEVFDLPKDLFSKLYKTEKLFGVSLTGNRIAIDSPERYVTAQNMIKTGII
jgi:mannose-1-phosphate guanylyltransferase/phosphomannomutase